MCNICCKNRIKCQLIPGLPQDLAKQQIKYSYVGILAIVKNTSLTFKLTKRNQMLYNLLSWMDK